MLYAEENIKSWQFADAPGVLAMWSFSALCLDLVTHVGDVDPAVVDEIYATYEGIRDGRIS